tara:strand:- start:505 stop:831 length:327 start_codon:yes stop_codon:yes gene_type:complete
MAYPDDHVLLSDMFGYSCTYNSGTGELTIKVAELPQVTDIVNISPTGIALALIKAMSQNQDTGENTRKIVVQTPTRLLASRGGVPSLRERFSVDFWDNFSEGHDPDDI